MAQLVFVSDIHIGSAKDPNYRLLIDFLNSDVLKRVSHLFFVGDIFDFWISDHLFLRREYSELISLLMSLKILRNLRVHYFEGNHDLHLKSFWRDELGLHVHEGPQLFDLKGFSLWVEHGDEINKMDRGYLFLRWLLRTGPMRVLAQELPGKILEIVGKKSSKLSRDYTSEQKVVTPEETKRMIRTHAKELYEAKPYDLLVNGHLHQRDEYFLNKDGELPAAINLGTWLDRPGYLWVDTDKRYFQMRDL